MVIMSLDDMWVHCTFLHIFEVFILEKRKPGTIQHACIPNHLGSWEAEAEASPGSLARTYCKI